MRPLASRRSPARPAHLLWRRRPDVRGVTRRVRWMPSGRMTKKLQPSAMSSPGSGAPARARRSGARPEERALSRGQPPRRRIEVPDGGSATARSPRQTLTGTLDLDADRSGAERRLPAHVPGGSRILNEYRAGSVQRRHDRLQKIAGVDQPLDAGPLHPEVDVERSCVGPGRQGLYCVVLDQVTRRASPRHRVSPAAGVNSEERRRTPQDRPAARRDERPRGRLAP